MRSAAIVLISAATYAILQVCGTACSKPDAPLQTKGPSAPTVGALMRQSGLTDTLTFISKYLGISENAALDSEYEYPRKKINAGLLKFKTTDGHVLTVDPKSGRLLRYVRLDRAKVPEGIGLKDALPESKALEIAQDFFAGQGIEIEPRTLRVTFRNIDGNPDPTLDHASWEIHFSRMYQDIHTDSHARLHVAAYRGEIVSFMDWPLMPPSTMDQNVSAEEALQTVKSFAAERGLTYERIEDPVLFVTRQNNRWEIDDLSTLEFKDESCLSWKVPLSNNTCNEYVVFVNASNGKIVGGI